MAGCVHPGAPDTRSGGDQPPAARGLASAADGALTRADVIAEDALPAAEVAPDVPRAAEIEQLPPAPPPIPSLAGPSQVAVWRAGRQTQLLERTEAREAGLMVLDIGTNWVPEIFRSTEDAPHAYELQFIELANGRFPDDAEGRRAKRDRYLELYGIPPSPASLAHRFAKLDRLRCARVVPSGPLLHFEGAERDDRGATTPPVDPELVRSLQARLACESHLRRSPTGQLDEPTQRALEEFERRNRIYARGSLFGETLEALKLPPLELERRALLRTLTERLVLALGVIEDDTAEGVEPQGKQAEAMVALGTAPNMVERVEQSVAEALGLRDVAGARELYRQLAEGMGRAHYFIAVPAVELPRYYDDAMDLFVEIDRGDVYYDFPMDELGQRREQPLERLPTLTLFVRLKDPEAPPHERRHREIIIPLANFGTTIGGWRIQRIGGADVWTYKESPVGERVWSRIMSAPVWLPPAGVPPETLVYQTRTNEEGETEWEVNDNLVGPGYASAYGLVAAYHQRFHTENGRRIPTRDEGIRSHGSSDYTSIWQRASLGCHRLHNHLAIRLFTFILAHREHRRLGHRSAGFRMPVSVPGFKTVIQVSRTGYAFDLREPLPVEALRGRIMGDQRSASRRRVPTEP